MAARSEVHGIGKVHATLEPIQSTGNCRSIFELDVRFRHQLVKNRGDGGARMTVDSAQDPLEFDDHALRNENWLRGQGLFGGGELSGLVINEEPSEDVSIDRADADALPRR